MGAEDITGGGEVVYLLAELRSAEQGPVHEIGSRARVLEADGDRLTLAVGYGRFESVVTCSRALVARAAPLTRRPSHPARGSLVPGVRSHLRGRRRNLASSSQSRLSYDETGLSTPCQERSSTSWPSYAAKGSGAVLEIGSRARVLASDGDSVTARGDPRRRRGHRHVLPRSRSATRTARRRAAARCGRARARPTEARRIAGCSGSPEPCYTYLWTQINDRNSASTPSRSSRPIRRRVARSLPRLRLRNLIEEATLADEVGLDVFAIGEHHRPDFAVSAPIVPLAAAAERTSRIRLSSAVTVLSSDDPVRVFQQFATLDLLSGGRAEIMAGRGSFIESFPLFGYDLADYDDLFAEKLDLLLRLRESEHVTWSGRLRPPLDDAGVYPRPTQDPLPVWIAVGGNPASAARAGSARPADGARDHRRHAGAVRAVRRDPPARRARGGARRSGAEHQLARVHRRHLAGGGRRVVAAVRRDDDQDRTRARLATDEPRATSKPRARCAVPTSSAARRRSSRRSSSSTRSSATSGSCSTSSSLDHAKTMRAIELYGTEVAPVVRAEVARRSPRQPRPCPASSSVASREARASRAPRRPRPTSAITNTA